MSDAGAAPPPQLEKVVAINVERTWSAQMPTVGGSVDDELAALMRATFPDEQAELLARMNRLSEAARPLTAGGRAQ